MMFLMLSASILPIFSYFHTKTSTSQKLPWLRNLPIPVCRNSLLFRGFFPVPFSRIPFHRRPEIRGGLFVIGVEIWRFFFFLLPVAKVVRPFQSHGFQIPARLRGTSKASNFWSIPRFLSVGSSLPG